MHHQYTTDNNIRLKWHKYCLIMHIHISISPIPKVHSRMCVIKNEYFDGLNNKIALI